MLAARATPASADPDPNPDADASTDADADADAAPPAQLAWDPEPAVTRGAPAPLLYTSTPTPSGLRFAMELQIGKFTKPVKIDATGPSGGKIAAITTARWKAATGPEKLYKLTLERHDGTRWVAVGRSRRVALGADKVRTEWPVHDRAQYRVTVMVRDKDVAGPPLRVEGELKTIVYR